MAFKIAEAFVEIKANNAQFDQGLKQAQSKLKQFAEAAKQFVIPLGIAGVGAAAARFFGDSVRRAGDLNETMSKVDVVFGESAQAVKDFGLEMNRQFGSSKVEILDAAASIGLVGKASGLSRAKAAEMGIALAKLADDGSSFHNVGLAEALTVIKSALVGEAEPIRRFGVLLNEAAVQAEAMKLGLATSKSELSEGAKVAARYSLILKGMADASGDHARTQGGYTNQIREFEGRITTLGQSLARIVLPAFNAMLSGINPVLEKIGELIDLAEQIPSAFGRAVASIKEMAGIVDDWQTAGDKGASWENDGGAAPVGSRMPSMSTMLAKAKEELFDEKVKAAQEKVTSDARVEQANKEYAAKKRLADLEYLRANRMSSAIVPTKYGGMPSSAFEGIAERSDNQVSGMLTNLGRLGQAGLSLGASKLQGFAGGAFGLGERALRGITDNADRRNKLAGSGGVSDIDTFQRDLQTAALTKDDKQTQQLEKANDILKQILEVTKAGKTAIGVFG